MADWYKRNPAKAMRAVHGLPFEVIGCYWVIVELIYIYGGPIANDPRWIAGMGSASTKSVQAWIKRLIEAGRLTEIDGKLCDERSLTTLREQADRGSTASKNGALGGYQKAVNASEANKNNALSLASASSRKKDKKEENKERETNVSPKKVGSRLSEDWQPGPLSPGAHRDADRIGAEATARQLERFRNYWVSKPGKDGVKTDWDRTWWNWLAKAAEAAPSRTPSQVAMIGF